MFRIITAKYNSACACGKRVKRGDRVAYYPHKRKVVCVDCTREVENGEQAERSMERYGTDCMYDS